MPPVYVSPRPSPSPRPPSTANAWSSGSSKAKGKKIVYGPRPISDLMCREKLCAENRAPSPEDTGCCECPRLALRQRLHITIEPFLAEDVFPGEDISPEEDA